ncbi:metal-dependent hydrolase [Novosphingobium sp. CCH12-A3]|uniref:metal-dependent hydrolase n=1 Tax=Novosphingobium sp. CCH12-A3 TaxID=1768752 RepID=UPI003514438D
MENADPEPTNMWRWHLAEELEHRSVCSDVYHELSGLNPVFPTFTAFTVISIRLCTSVGSS